MKNKKNLFLSALFSLLILLVLFVFNPFQYLNIFGNQVAYPPVSSTPFAYWQFESSPWRTPTIGSANFTDGTCAFTQKTGGPVGKYIEYLDSAGCYKDTASMPSTPVTSFAMEFLWKPGDIMATNFINSTDGSFNIYLESPMVNSGKDVYPYIDFSTTGTNGSNTVSDTFRITLSGVGPKSPAYYNDGNWHHMVFKYSNGVKEVWVDGTLPAGFSKTVPNTNKIKTSGGMLKFFGNSVSYRKYLGTLDQVAYYSSPSLDVLPGNLIHQHYIDSIQNGQSYSFSTTLSSVPNAPAVVAGFKATDYLPGAQTNAYNIAGRCCWSVPYTEYSQTPPTVSYQLKDSPLPRYKTGHVLLPNFNWNSLDYMAHLNPNDWSYTHSAAQVQEGVAIAGELAQKWNYYLDLEPARTSSNLETGVSGAPGLYSYSNSNPTLPTSMVIFRAQINGSNACGGGSNTPCLKYQNFSNQYYLQNLSGQFVDRNGNITTNKTWRPIQAHNSVYNPDGVYTRDLLSSITNQLTKPNPKINFLSENGEIVHKFEGTNVLQNDPLVNAAMGSEDPDTYAGRVWASMANSSYRDIILALPALNGAKFLEYGVDGFEDYTRFKWSEARKAQTAINGTYYATPDYYAVGSHINGPAMWRGKDGPNNGVYFFQKILEKQLPTGDKFSAPFISPGWKRIVEKNMVPGQYLGISKNLQGLGAEFFHSSYFNRPGSDDVDCNDGKDNDGDGQIDFEKDLDNNNSISTTEQLTVLDSNCSSQSDNNESQNGGPESREGWPGQKAYVNMMPSYSQGAFSRIDTLFKNSTLLPGDLPLLYSTTTSVTPGYVPGYAFRGGRMDAFTTVRKENGANRYIITTNLNQYTNMIGAVPESAPITINLDGQQLKFDTRPQGSVYVYDNTNTSSPVFYQVDKWHESTHPYYWSKDFSIEAELFDSGSAQIKTEGGNITSTPRDFTSSAYTTYINPSSGSTTYKFEPRNATGSANKTYYLWYFAKSSSGTSTASVKVDAGTTQTISSNSTTFGWCNKNQGGTPIVFSGITPNTAHTFTFTGISANFQLDKFILTENASLNLGSCGPETIPPTVSVTNPSNGLNVTVGSTVNISADANDASGIASVEFFVDGVSVGLDNSQPYSASWDTTGATGGVHSITAVAIDNVGNQATSTPVDVNILSGTFVAITTPIDGAVLFSGQTYPMQAVVGGPITKVRYFRFDTNTNVTRKCASTIAPNFNCNWTPNGGILNLTVDFLIHAKGYDAQGNIIATSPTITVTRTAGGGNRDSGGGSNTDADTNTPEADTKGQAEDNQAYEEGGSATIDNGLENGIINSDGERNAVDMQNPREAVNESTIMESLNNTEEFFQTETMDQPVETSPQ